MSTMTLGTTLGTSPSPTARGASSPGSTRHLTLTRRGRIVVFTAALLVTLAALVLAVMPTVVATDTTGDPLPVTQVTVQPGDTLWEIAAAANPGGDVTATVDEIAQLNAISDGQLSVGQELAVPAY